MSTSQPPQIQGNTLFGHPVGLFTLFFAEMWERFSYYGMRALLLFYMLKGFLRYGDSAGYAVYGSYTALVYMTPFFGGMLADRILGARRAVILGGLLMAAGHLMMTIEQDVAFFTALALLITGNGFFKPNISTIVGSLYPQGSTKRDGGFTIFYMGINLGAAMSPLLCGYIGETYGWHYGFGLATLGMLLGVAVFANWMPPNNAGAPPDQERLRQKPIAISQTLIIIGGVVAAVALFVYRPTNPFSIAINVFVGVALLIAAGVACIALRKDVGGFITIEWGVYLAALLVVPVFALLVSGFSPLTKDKRPISVIPDSFTKDLTSSERVHQQLDELERIAKEKGKADGLAKQLKTLHDKSSLRDDQYEELKKTVELAKAGEWDKVTASVPALKNRFPLETFNNIAGTVLEEISKPAGLILFLSGIVALIYLGAETLRLDQVARQRMYVVFVLTFFSMLFWAFFEQAGSSVNNFTDRNVDRVLDGRTLAASEVGSTVKFRIPPETDDKQLQKLPLLSQEQLGQRYGGDSVTKRIEAAIRSANEKESKENRLDEEAVTELVRTVTKDNILTMTGLTYLRNAAAASDAKPEEKVVDWVVAPENVGMAVGGSEIPASVFQAVNPIYILVLGVAFSALWTFLGARKLEPNTAVKFALGLLQLGLGFGAFWYGAYTADARGMVAVFWLLLGYLLHTTGELCISPVGLSMVTKLSPMRLVSTVMGMWFLATAFSQFLAAIIAQFTRVSHGDSQIIPMPKETVNIYGNVFFQITIMASVAAVLCFALAPLLHRWMHEDVLSQQPPPASDDSNSGSEHIRRMN